MASIEEITEISAKLGEIARRIEVQIGFVLSGTLFVALVTSSSRCSFSFAVAQAVAPPRSGEPTLH